MCHAGTRRESTGPEIEEKWPTAVAMGYPKGSANAGEKNEERNKIPETVAYG